MTADKAESKLLVCKEIDENFLKNIITGNETKIYVYDPDTKQQSSHWNFPTSQWLKESLPSMQQNQNDTDC